MFIKKKKSIEFKKWLGIVLGVILLTVITLRFWPKSDRPAVIEVGGQKLSVLVADSFAEHYQGLSDRDTLEPYHGMIFLFDTKKTRTFVMRRMRFSLDIIWIDDTTIVDIASNLPPEPNIPESQLTLYTGKSPADKVLEVPAGFAERYGIKIGDRIVIK